MSGTISLNEPIQSMPPVRCEVCGKYAEVIVTSDDHPLGERAFCDRHYDDWCNNEIELPAERIERLYD